MSDVIPKEIFPYDLNFINRGYNIQIDFPRTYCSGANNFAYKSA